tara:strand:+ start:3020 stop:3928 length:909 start_codon:yes stop_codon:yes gene_type:complete
LKNFINLSDIKEDDLRKIIANAKSKKLKKNLNNKDKALINKTLIMIFEKPSTRTRISFELAMKRLGGNSIILNPEQIHYGRGNENIHDTAKVLSQYGDIIMMRAEKHENFLKFSKYLNIPIINGLTDLNHPCQTMSDIATFEELKGSIKNKKIAWLGDGNNIVYSLIEASVKFNFQLAIACPKKLEPNKKIVKWAKNKKAKILITQDPKKAVNLADCIMTDKWISMGDKSNEKKKKKLLKPYQVNEKIMRFAKADAIFMHCLPASRGEEVTNKIMDGKQSAVWLQASNRVYVQESIIEWCLK